MEIFNTIGTIAGATGLDCILLLVVVLGTWLLRILFPKVPEQIIIKEKIFLPVPVLYALGIGIIIGIAHIFIGKIPRAEWLRTILGYPLVGIVIYMLFRKILPDSNILKPPAEDQQGKGE